MKMQWCVLQWLNKPYMIIFKTMKCSGKKWLTSKKCLYKHIPYNKHFLLVNHFMVLNSVLYCTKATPKARCQVKPTQNWDASTTWDHV